MNSLQSIENIDPISLLLYFLKGFSELRICIKHDVVLCFSLSLFDVFSLRVMKVILHLCLFTGKPSISAAFVPNRSAIVDRK